MKLFDSLYKALSKIFRRKQTFEEFIISLPVNSIQRRSFIRIEMLFPVSFTRLAGRPKVFDTDESSVHLDHSAICVNLSANGILILTNEQLAENDYVRIGGIFFTHPLVFYAQVIRLNSYEAHEVTINEAALNIVYINSENQWFLAKEIMKRCKDVNKLVGE